MRHSVATGFRRLDEAHCKIAAVKWPRKLIIVVALDDTEENGNIVTVEIGHSVRVDCRFESITFSILELFTES